MGLIPITEKNFRKKLKGCGIKNYSLIPKKELKEKLGFCSKNKPQRKVEISDDDGFSGIFQSMANAAKVCQIPNASTIKYALDRKKDIFRRRSDNKKFYIREILDETKSATESDEIKSEIDDSETDDSETDVSDVEEDKLSNFDFESDSEPEAEIVFESDSQPESEPDQPFWIILRIRIRIKLRINYINIFCLFWIKFILLSRPFHFI